MVHLFADPLIHSSYDQKQKSYTIRVGGDPASLKKQLMGGMRTMWHMFSHRFL